MKPGMQFGKAVTVPYLLPIIFKVQSDSLSVSTNKTPILNLIDGDTSTGTTFSNRKCSNFPWM